MRPRREFALRPAMGEGDGKDGALLPAAADLDLPPVGLGDGVGDGQPQTVAPLLPATGAVHPVEPLKQVLQVLRGDGLAGVPHREDRPLLPAGEVHVHPSRFPGVFHRVVQQDHHQPFQAVRSTHPVTRSLKLTVRESLGRSAPSCLARKSMSSTSSFIRWASSWM